MRILNLLVLTLPLAMACNPTGVEEATGEAIVVDKENPNPDVQEANMEGLDALVPKLKETVCTLKGEQDPEKKTKLEKERDALVAEGQAELDKLSDQSERKDFETRLGAAYSGEGC